MTENYEIVIPKLFGAEVKKDIAVASGARKRWDEASFFEDAALFTVNSSGNLFLNFHWLYAFAPVFKDALEKNTPFRFSKDYEKKYFTYPIAEWHAHLAGIIKAVENLLA